LHQAESTRPFTHPSALPFAGRATATLRQSTVEGEMPVTTIDSPANFLHELKKHQCVEPQQLGELNASRFPDARSLAQNLLQRGWLTPYQVNQIFQGAGRDLVVGPYLILERLGEGASGQVYKARHIRMKRIAAVKVIRPELLTQPDAVQRFYREVQVTGRLSHPNIVGAFDAGPTARGHFLAMELIEGTDLERLVKRRGPFPLGTACECIRQAALGLQHAFEHGMVHRDIKPSNLMLTRGPGAPEPGIIKILDLGLVHMSRELAATLACTLTENGTMLGTPDYMAPEQAENTSKVDIRADIYSLGSTFYFLLSGQVPFPNCSLMQKLLKLQTADPVPVEKVRSDIPAGVAGLVRKMMARRQEDRIATPAEVAAALTALQQGKSVKYSLPASAGPPSASTTPTRSIMPAELFGSARRFSSRLTDPALSLTSTILKPPRLGLLWLAARARNWLRRHRFLVIFGILGLLTLFVAFVALLLSFGPSQVESEWQRLAAQLNDPLVDKQSLRPELVAFRLRHPGTPLSVRAAEQLMALPSPLDKLGPGQIPSEEQVAGLPREVVAVLGKHRPPPLSFSKRILAFSPQQLLVASVGNEGVGASFQVAHLASGNLRASWTMPVAVQSAALSADGKLAAIAGADYVIRIWDVATAKETAALTGHTRPVVSLSFAQDGLTLASGSTDNSMRVWDIAAAKEKAAFTSTTMVRAVSFTPDGQLLASLSLDRAIRLWDLGGKGLVATIQLPTTVSVTTLGFSPDSKLMAISAGDNTVRVSTLAGKERVTLKGHTQPVHLLAFHPDGKSLTTASYDRTVRQWDVATGKETGMFSGHAAMPMMCLAYANDGGTLIAATVDQTVWEWDGRSPALVAHGHADWRTAAAVAPDGQTIATGSRSGLVCLWDAGTREIRTSFHAHAQAITAIGYTPDNSILVTASADRTAKLWEPVSGKLIATLAGHTHHVLALAFAADGQTIATAGGDQIIKLWNLEGKELRTLRGHARAVRAVAFTPDTRFLISGGSDGALRSWDAPSGELRAATPPAPTGIAALAQGSHGAASAADTDATIRLWNGASGKLQSAGVLTGHTGSVRALAYRLDGQQLASAGDDGRIVLWEAGKKRHEWLLPGGRVTGLDYASDGRHLTAVNANGVVYVLRVP